MRKIASLKKSKSNKQSLLFPINEKDDWLGEEIYDRLNKHYKASDKPDVLYKVLGKGDLKAYKGNAKKVHEIYSERLIGQNTSTKYLLSSLKLKKLIFEVKILKILFRKKN